MGVCSFSSTSSSMNEGGSGRSGMFLGGDGVWNSIFEILENEGRGGVCKEKARCIRS